METATHDDLRNGETATRTGRFQVLARDETEAKLVACQMAARDDRMPTRATVVDPLLAIVYLVALLLAHKRVTSALCVLRGHKFKYTLGDYVYNSPTCRRCRFPENLPR